MHSGTESMRSRLRSGKVHAQEVTSRRLSIISVDSEQTSQYKQHLYTSAASRSMTYGLPPSRVRSAIRASWRTGRQTCSPPASCCTPHLPKSMVLNSCVERNVSEAFNTWHANAPANGTVRGLRRSGSFACRQQTSILVSCPGSSMQRRCSALYTQMHTHLHRLFVYSPPL